MVERAEGANSNEHNIRLLACQANNAHPLKNVRDVQVNDYCQAIYLYAQKYNITSKECKVGRTKISVRINTLREFCKSKNRHDIMPPEFHWKTYRDIKPWLNSPNEQLDALQLAWKTFHFLELVPIMNATKLSIPNVEKKLQQWKRKVEHLELYLNGAVDSQVRMFEHLLRDCLQENHSIVLEMN